LDICAPEQEEEKKGEERRSSRDNRGASTSASSLTLFPRTMAPAAASQPAAYEKNEKVLCFHHELLYEAKILDDPQREDEKDKTSPWRYRVHYKGWKNT
jgi:hypothetical protein